MSTVVSVFGALNTISVYSKLEAFGPAAVVRTFAVAHVVLDLYQIHNINEHSGSNLAVKWHIKALCHDDIRVFMMHCLQFLFISAV